MKSTLRGLAAAAALLVLMTACSGDPGESPPGDTKSDTKGSTDGAVSADPLGPRADVLTALEAATGASGGEWDGDLMVLEFAEGGKDDPSAMVNCSAVNTLIAEGERAVLVYPDGELDCEDQGR